MPRSHPETLYRLPTYDQARTQARLRFSLLVILLDGAAALLLAGSWLGHRWGNLTALGPAWLHFLTYPHLPLLAAALAGTFLALLLLALLLPGSTRPAALRLLPYLLPLLLVLVPLLGSAALIPLYSPLVLLRWASRFQHHPSLASALHHAFSVGLTIWASLATVTLAATLASLRSLHEDGDTHGSSHWASPREVRATGLLQPHGGVTLGTWRSPRGRLHRLGDTRDRHVLAFAPSGSGKSTCLVIPTLFEWTGSAVVLDIKGELWQATAGYRKHGLGQRCLRFDPSAPGDDTAAYNPLLVIPRGPEDVSYAQSVADVLVDPEGRDQPRTFWDQSAHALLTGVLLHVLYAEPDKSLAGCAHLLANPGRPVATTLEAMLQTLHDPAGALGWCDPHSGSPTRTHPVVAASARALLDMDPRTASGVVATALSHLDLFRDPILAANTARSDFTARDLVHGDRPVTLYLTLSPAVIDRLRPVLRLVLNQLCRQLTHLQIGAPATAGPWPAVPSAVPGRPLSSPPRLPSTGPAAGRIPLLLLLDEFTALGKLDFFGRAMAYLRGFSIRVYLSLQSLSQLTDVYGPHQSLSANCPLQIAFAPADVETAELLSRMTGPMTVSLTRRSLSGTSLALTPKRATISQHDLARPLLTAEEVRRLPDHEALVFTAGHPPIRAVRAPYFNDPALARLAAIPWPACSDRIEREAVWEGEE